MIGYRGLVHSVFLLLLPVIVAWYGLSVASAIGLVLLALLWRWMISLSGMLAPASVPELELDTISASHFVEKTRWCMDLLGLDYVEKPAAGAIGAFFLGRTVPRLKFRTGAVRSSIGNSAEILRYLWGRYAPVLGERADFLSADAQRLELEQKIDRCGVDLQIWVYHHILDDPSLALHAWGVSNKAIPAWQRVTVRVLYPMMAMMIRKSFGITEARHAKAIEHVNTLLAEVETALADGRKSILGGDQVNYTDISFAAIMGLWLQPVGYGGGKADSVRIERDQVPKQMAVEIEHWSNTYPKATQFIETLFAEHRNPAS